MPLSPISTLASLLNQADEVARSQTISAMTRNDIRRCTSELRNAMVNEPMTGVDACDSIERLFHVLHEARHRTPALAETHKEVFRQLELASGLVRQATGKFRYYDYDTNQWTESIDI